MKQNMKLAALMAALAIFASAALAGCSADIYEDEPAYSRNLHGYIDQFSATETPSAEPADADPEESVSLDDPVGITTPETEAPATQPPATQPPATQPPATRPPATQPPATQPPATQAPPTQTPSTPAPAP